MLVIADYKCQWLLIHLITIPGQEAMSFMRPQEVVAQWDGQTNKPSAVFLACNEKEEGKKEEDESTS